MNKNQNFHINGKLHHFDYEFVRRHLDYGKVEAFLTSVTIDPDKSKSRLGIGGAPGEGNFAVVREVPSTQFYNSSKKRIAVHISPENLIGYGDSDFIVNQPIEDSNYPQMRVTVLPEDSGYVPGSVIYLPRGCGREEIQGYTPIKASEITNISGEWKKYPLTFMCALRISYLQKVSVTIESVFELLRSLEMIPYESDFCAKLPMSGPITPTFTPDISQKLIAKYAMDNLQPEAYASADYFFGCNDGVLFVTTATRGKDGKMVSDGRQFPLAFYRYGKRPFPISFPGFNTDNTPLSNLPSMKDGEPVYLTEYQELADWNCPNEDMTVVAPYGGEYGLSRADFRPLVGKKVIILEIPATEDPDNSRAHRFTLKAFAELYKKGCRSCLAFVWNTSEEIDFATLEREAYAAGYLKRNDDDEAPQLAFEEILKWPKVEKRWPLIGRSFFTGETSLIYAQSACCKTMIELLKAVVLITGKSQDEQLLEYKAFGSHVKVLYVQKEMSEVLIKERLDSIGDYLKIDCANLIHWHTPQGALDKRDEQEMILKRLAELDPKGESKWVVVVDTIKSLMPDVLAGDGSKFSTEITPWLRFMNDRGISVDLLHHENKGGEASGPTTVVNLVDNAYRIKKISKINEINKADCCIEATKQRTLTGDQCAPVFFHLSGDSKQRILELKTKYLDADEADHEASPSSEAQSSEDAVGTTTPALPSPQSLDELRTCPENIQREILLERWSQYGTKAKVGESLKCSESSIENQMRSLGINKDSLAEYTKAKMGQ